MIFNEANPSYFIKSESMKKAVELGKIKIIGNLADCITTKQDRWHNAGVLAFPLKINKFKDGKVKIKNLTTFNSDNYVTLINQENAVTKTLQANNRCKIAVPIEDNGFNENGKTNISLNNYIQESYTYNIANPKTIIGTITTNIKSSKLAIPIKNEYLKIEKIKDFTNFFTLPRSSDGQLINGAWNRYWKITNAKAYVGTVAATNPIKLAIPILEVNKDYDYRMSDGTKRPIGKINKEGKTTIPITNNHTANKFGVSVVPTITTSGTTKVALPAIKPIPGIPIFIIEGKPYHLRVLTEQETFLLQGFPIETFNKIDGIAKSHLYHMAGNSIPVPVLESLFVELFPWLFKTTKKEDN
ncbi:MAG: DNA cytosine methyltransferase [Spiroplasma sp.]